jgi:hypothetical protein
VSSGIHTDDVILDVAPILTERLTLVWLDRATLAAVRASRSRGSSA